MANQLTGTVKSLMEDNREYLGLLSYDNEDGHLYISLGKGKELDLGTAAAIDARELSKYIIKRKLTNG